MFKEINKMYYKMEDVKNSCYECDKIRVSNNVTVIVQLIGIDTKSFACTVTERKRDGQKNIYDKIFYNISHFNEFVKVQRWLND